jgi:phosphoribosylaminoimidazole-succinocarboxamide synthase
MPCRYDPGPEDYLRTEKQKVAKLTKDLDKLTAENDRLREALLNLINDKDYVLPAEVVKEVQAEQVKHRKADLKRLERVFLTNKDALRLGKVLLADPKKPLEPQLGFDADEF